MTFDDKWPVMVVTGMPISLDLAGEVIRRTDRFFTTTLSPGGNDHDWDARLIARLHLPDREHATLDRDRLGAIGQRFSRIYAWQRRWGAIETSYVHNDWISTCGRPDGWCRPDGQIACSQRIGKWPGKDEVHDDWRRLAAAFPFLDLVASVFHDDEIPLPSYSIVVQDGETNLVVPGEAALHDRFGEIPDLAERAALNAELAKAERTGNWSVFEGRGYAHEHATLPETWLADWAHRGAQIDDETRAAEREVGELIGQIDALSGTGAVAGAVDEARERVQDAIRAHRDEGDVAWIDVLLRELDVERIDERIGLQILSSTLGIPNLRNRGLVLDGVRAQICRHQPDDADRILAPFS